MRLDDRSTCSSGGRGGRGADLPAIAAACPRGIHSSTGRLGPPPCGQLSPDHRPFWPAGDVGARCHDVRMQEAVELERGVALIAAAPCRPAVLSDDDLLADVDRWEALGRLVDARRTALAGEVAWRSRDQVGEASLARRRGDRNGTDLLARELRISERAARRRTRLGLR